nr:hybrid signal transduction histidine kinase M [Tanacetum cinerariifolium]
MDRFDVNRGSLLESKHRPKVPSVTLPPLPLVAFCGIVVFLLSLSQYSNLQSWLGNIGISFQTLVLLTPIGKLSVNEYCTKIKSMANRLKNLDCEVSEKNMVICTVNGLDSWFATLAEIIRHREPLPSFETDRNMLLLKESSFNDSTDDYTMLESSSSSPIILMASSSSDAKGPVHEAHSVQQQQQPTVAAQHPSMYMGQRQVQSSQRMTHSNNQEILGAALIISLQLGVDFDETFSLVVKPATIRMVLSLAVSLQWPIHNLDVKNAFLNIDLSKTVYMHQLSGFTLVLLKQIINSLHKEFDMTDLLASLLFVILQGKDYAKSIKKQSKPGIIEHEIERLHQKPNQMIFFYKSQVNKAKSQRNKRSRTYLAISSKLYLKENVKIKFKG